MHQNGSLSGEGFRLLLWINGTTSQCPLRGLWAELQPSSTITSEHRVTPVFPPSPNLRWSSWRGSQSSQTSRRPPTLCRASTSWCSALRTWGGSPLLQPTRCVCKQPGLTGVVSQVRHQRDSADGGWHHHPDGEVHGGHWRSPRASQICQKQRHGGQTPPAGHIDCYSYYVIFISSLFFPPKCSRPEDTTGPSDSVWTQEETGRCKSEYTQGSLALHVDEDYWNGSVIVCCIFYSHLKTVFFFILFRGGKWRKLTKPNQICFSITFQEPRFHPCPMRTFFRMPFPVHFICKSIRTVPFSHQDYAR